MKFLIAISITFSFLMGQPQFANAHTYERNLNDFISQVRQIQKYLPADRNIIFEQKNDADHHALIDLEVINRPSLKNAYKNGDFYFLVGNLGSTWSQTEWELFFKTAHWLVRNYFRVIINPVAQNADLREAVQNPHMSALVWSSHGQEKTGILLDSLDHEVPQDIFSKGSSPLLKFLILSNCNGELTKNTYSFPPGIMIHYWEGATYTKDLFYFLNPIRFKKTMESVFKQEFKNPTVYF